MSSTHGPVAQWRRQQVRDGVWSEGSRAIPEETAIAFIIEGASEAVMMATPADLEDFACGFALTERLIETLADIRELEFVQAELGIEARLWLRDGARSAHASRRRRRAGPVGCGLCGVESLEAAMPALSPVQTNFRILASELIAAMTKLPASQPFNAATRAVHAAALYRPGEDFVFVREDVGRHNALDKLIGAMAREGRGGADGAILITSRVSIELIQKTAHIGAGVLAAISAPTALAVETAEAAGICVCGLVRENGLEVFTHADRIMRDAD